jgi:Mn-containing catalase
MFLHRKELMQPVIVGTPDARFGTYLLEQFGGATGELTAALQYWVQSFHVENAGIRDMLQDIAIEEFSHLEMVGKLIAEHTSKLDQTSIRDAPLFKIKGGGPHFLESQGSCWTAAYIQEGRNVVRDLRANISAEAGARQTYESLIKACDDEGTKKTLHHLLTHANMFMKALDQMGKLDDPFFGNIPPDETVKLVFNLSRGEDEHGPWNEEPDFEYVDNPEPEGGLPPEPINPMTKATSLRLAKPGHPERRTSTRCREGPRLTESATLQRLSDPLGYFFSGPAYSPFLDDGGGGEASLGPSPSV